MDSLAQQFIAFADTPWAPILLCVHAFLEASFLPGAHDFLIIAMTIAKPHLWYFFALCSTLGSTCGGCFGYAIGRFGGRYIVEKIGLKKYELMIESYYKKFGLWAVAFAGFTPVPFKLFVFFSGMFEISFIPFVIIAALARGARFFIVSALVYFIGTQIKDYVVTYLNIFSIICLSIALLVYIIVRIYKKNKSCITTHDQPKEDLHV